MSLPKEAGRALSRADILATLVFVTALALAGCGPASPNAGSPAPAPVSSDDALAAEPMPEGDREGGTRGGESGSNGEPRVGTTAEAGTESGRGAESEAGRGADAGLVAPGPSAGASAADGGAGADGSRAARPYGHVIPEDAVSSHGLFSTHRVEEKLYFEIPQHAFDRDMLLLRRAYGGTGGGASHVIRWERKGDRVFLREQRFQLMADRSASISGAVREMADGPIIADFDIETLGANGEAVIEVSHLYTRNVREFAGVGGISSSRSMIESVHAFDGNVEIEGIQTGTIVPPGSSQGTSASTNTVRFHWSMSLLPDPMMLPRLHDSRVGYNSIRHIDYTTPAHGSKVRRFIRRFRLEKEDDGAEVSRPVKPIVFWIDAATPEWLVPWVQQGVEAWQPAFEAAGFEEAIVARRAPTPEEDPTWSMFDGRHSMIYWRASETENANGGHVADPRTGEILKAEVNVFHNVMNLLQRWYFIQAGPLDERAALLPLPDSLMGRLVSYVVSHEVGHAIGLPHNMKASSAYDVDDLRDPEFLAQNGGHVPSIMDYSRFNYVAQPEDGIPPELLIPRVGPYDHFSVMWGYRPIADARTSDDERPLLAEWVAVQDSLPWLRFQTSGAINDPGNLTEAVGSSDAVRSSELGLRNLERVMKMLIPAAERPGEDYALLRELYSETVAQWGRYMSHVAAVIGGAESRERHGTGRRFEPVGRARQQEAVDFLVRNAFDPPLSFVDPEILRRVEAHGVVDRIRTAQERVLMDLFSDSRMNRLVEYEALAEPGEAYTLADLMADVRQGVWREMDAEEVHIDIFRRNLQRAYLDAVDRQLNPDGGGTAASRRKASSDARAIVRGELAELEGVVKAAIERAPESMTRLHLRDVGRDIEKILDQAR